MGFDVQGVVPERLAKNCHILSAVDDDGITLEMQRTPQVLNGQLGKPTGGLRGSVQG